MALPKSKEIEQLKELNDQELFDYFCRNTRYSKENPLDSQYAILLGSRALFSHDTRDLREKFFRFVRNGDNELRKI